MKTDYAVRALIDLAQRYGQGQVQSGDIAARHVWKDGVRTVEIARKRVTNSEFDVQFSDKKEYAFGAAVFDNAQVRHAYTPGVLKMVLE